MANVSDASAGGAGGAAGVGFQNLVFAWAASCIVAEEPLLGSLVAGTATAVGAQTGSEVDDVVILTDAGNAAFVQAKIKLQLSADPDSPFAKGLTQAVRQYLSGSVAQRDGGTRAVDHRRDAIVLCTDQAAPATVRVELAAAVSRVGSHPAGTPLDDQLTKKQNDALNVALGQTRSLWAAENGGNEPTREDLRRFLKCLRVLTLDLADGGNDRQAAISVLHRGLEMPSQAGAAWQTLVGAAQAASEARQWRDRATLALAMAQHDISMTVNDRYAAAIATLRDRSSVNLAKLQAEALLPVPGGLFIPRAAARVLREVKSREPILVVGDAGSGKSAVLQDFATFRRGAEEVIVLLAEDVAGANRLETGPPLREVLRAWTGPPALLVIDGVDALRGPGDRETLSNTVSGLAGSRWQVVASARSFDTSNSRPLQAAFAGSPISISKTEVDPRLTSVRHIFVGELADDDLDRELVAPMPLATLLAEAPNDLRSLLRNAFNLRLAAELTASLTKSQHDELLRVRTRVDLLDRYWKWRIQVEGFPARVALLRRLVMKMVTSRRLHLDPTEPTVLGTESAALEDLLSQGVLASVDGPIPALSRAIKFSHNILFDYAAAIYVLFDEFNPAGGLVDRLDADPTLPLVARPSFDLLVDLLWQVRSKGVFWPVALAVADSDHVLASLAFASRVANLLSDAEDLIELAATDGEASNEAMTGKQHLTRQIAGAVRAPSVVPDAGTAVVPLARLARALAENAFSYYTNAALAADLVLALQRRVPVGSPDDGTSDRALAIAILLDTCRTDPAGREVLAGTLTRQVQFVVARSSEVRDAMRRVLDDGKALAQWGGTVTAWFPEIAVKAVEVDPGLAHSLAVTSMTFKETRDEQVGLGISSILPLHESRQQQASRAAYALGEAYPELAATDVSVAAAIVCDVINHIEPTGLEAHARERDDAPTWPLATPNSSGWIEHNYGFGLSTYWHDDEQKMLGAVAEALLSASNDVVVETLDLLASRLHVGWGWAALMNNSSDPAALFRVLQPLFSTGTLLAHPNTYAQAAILLNAAADEGSVPPDDLERAVRKAIELLEAHDRGDHIKDVLVGCLDRNAVTDVALASHLDALGDEVPEIPSPPSMAAEVRAWSTVDRILEQDESSLSSSLEAAARALEQALNDVREDKASDAELAAILVNNFIDAHATFSSEHPIHPRLDHMLLDAAVRLTYFPGITPVDPAGSLVFRVLDAKADDPDAGRFFS